MKNVATTPFNKVLAALFALAFALALSCTAGFGLQPALASEAVSGTSLNACANPDEGDADEKSEDKDALDKSTVKVSVAGAYASNTASDLSSTKRAAAGKKLALGHVTGTKAVNQVALKLSVSSTALEKGYKAGIKYSVRVNGKWTGWKSNFKTAGAKASSISGLRVKLTGDAADYYNVYYQLNFRGIGSLGWVKNGTKTGVYKYGAKVRCVKVMLKKKSAEAPSSSAPSSITGKEASGSVTVYKASGVSKAAKFAHVAGTARKGKAITGISAKMKSSLSGKLVYSAYTKGKGWSGYKENGEIATVNNGKVNCVKMKLTGKMAKYYYVCYRVYVKGYGWMGWAKSNTSAGSKTVNVTIRAIQVRLWLKGTTIKLNTSNYYSGENGVLCDIARTKILAAKVKNLSSSTKYAIVVDTHRNRVGVFKGSKGNWTMVKYFLCTSGAAGSPTVKGVFTTKSKGLVFGSGYSCWYFTQITGNYLFHSVLYNPGSKTSIQDGRLGINASHGCVRLAIGNAKWIYNKIPYGTTVKIF